MKIWLTLCLASLSLSALAVYNPEFDATVTEFIEEGIRPEKSDMVGLKRASCHYSISKTPFTGVLYGKIEDQQLLASFQLDSAEYAPAELSGTWKINRGLAIYYHSTEIGALQRYEVRKNNGELLIKVNDSMYCRAGI
jgi:hypothetical protein